MEAISRAVENGKEHGLSEQNIKDAVREGLNRHERRRNAALARRESKLPVARVPYPEPAVYCDPEIGQ